jgi:hypothetical protein
VLAGHEANEALDQIGDEAEGTRLFAVAEDGQGFAGQGLHHEVGNHAAVVFVHARAVGVEDARDADLDAVLVGVGRGQRLGATLALVVAGARADGIDVAPIGFRLRVLGRIAVHFAGRGNQHARAALAGHVEQVQRALDGGANGAHGIALVVNGRRRASQVEDLVHLHGQRLLHVVAEKLEARMLAQVRDVGVRAGEEVVQAHDLVPVGQQALAQVRADKARASSDQYAFAGHVTGTPATRAWVRQGPSPRR